MRTFVIPESREEREICAQTIYKAILSEKTGWEVSIHAPDKTKRQRGQFHATVSEISKKLGYSPAEIKSLIKEDYLGFTEIKIGNQYKRVLRSSEELNRDEYSILIDYIPVWLAKYGLDI